MVDLTGDLVKTLSYDIGTKGGTYSYNEFHWYRQRELSRTYIPLALARLAYENPTFWNIVGQLDPNSDGQDIVAAIAAGFVGSKYVDATFEARLKNRSPFILFANRSLSSPWYSDTTYSVENYYDNYADCEGRIVGTFDYGAC